jgi:NAD(P)-dependent dehydrogenase (short-subunit alcohol dehydrogenase family)
MQGKAVVITGALGTLGAETARMALARGARVALIGHAANAPAQLAAQLGPAAIMVPGADLAEESAATAAINQAQGRLGALDVLINAAGSFSWEQVAGGRAETWDRLFRSNLVSVVNACRAAIPHLRHSRCGRIVNVGAKAALHAATGMGAYTASKAGVHRLTESLAAELKADAITVNAVLPSIIDTPANRSAMPKEDFSSWVTPQALANVILFLASDEAQAITGALLPVSGRV